MKLNAEDELIRRLVGRLPSGEGLVVGPGDDCAAVRLPGARRLLLLKTDCVVEGVHFLRAHDPGRIGWKALCRPLSDIAAMGGVPGQALVTLFSPPGIPRGYWEKFYRGLERAARRFGVGIAGGEVSRQPAGIAVSVALTGTVAAREMVLRSGGRPGDDLYVTGRLGGSLGGHHMDFVPRIAEGRWLAETVRPRAMMDISDGLGSDLPRLAAASGCGFEVDLESLPRNRGCDAAAALSDGEDYELLFAASRRVRKRLEERWRQAFPRVKLTRIGRLTDSGEAPAGWPGGWDHFSVVRSGRAGEFRDGAVGRKRPRRS